jgi:plastocyanin
MKKHASLLVWGLMLFSLGLALASCGKSGDGSTAGEATAQVVDCGAVTPAQTVDVGEYYFDPSLFTLVLSSTNGTVKWTNSGTLRHSVTTGTSGVADGMIDETLDPGGSVCLQFTAPGDFRYFCKFHPTQMSGDITVQ